MKKKGNSEKKKKKSEATFGDGNMIFFGLVLVVFLLLTIYIRVQLNLAIPGPRVTNNANNEC